MGHFVFRKARGWNAITMKPDQENSKDLVGRACVSKAFGKIRYVALAMGGQTLPSLPPKLHPPYFAAFSFPIL